MALACFELNIIYLILNATLKEYLWSKWGQRKNRYPENALFKSFPDTCKPHGIIPAQLFPEAWMSGHT